MANELKLGVKITGDLRDIKQGLAQLQGSLRNLRKDASQKFAGIEGLQRQLNGAAGAAKNLLGILGVSLGAGALVNYIKNTINAADATAKMSKQVNLSVEALSRLEYGAELANVSREELRVGLVKFNNDLARNGTLLKKMGVDTLDSADNFRSVESIFSDVADLFQSLPEGPNRAALAIKLFGEQGVKLLPLLTQGSAGIREFSDESDRLGRTLTQEQAEASELFNDNLTRIKGSVQGVVNVMVSELLPSVNTYVGELSNSAQKSNLAKEAGSGLATVFKLLAGGAVLVKNGVEAIINVVLFLSDVAIEAGKVVKESLVASFVSAGEVARGFSTGGVVGAARAAMQQLGDLAATGSRSQQEAIRALRASYETMLDGVGESVRDVTDAFDALAAPATDVKGQVDEVAEGAKGVSKEGLEANRILGLLLNPPSGTDGAKKKAEALRKELEALRKEAEKADAARRAELIQLEERIAKGLEDVEIALLRAGGREADAAIIEINRKWEGLITDLKNTGNTAGLELVERLINTEALAAKLGEFKARAAEILGSLQAGETSLSAQAGAGMLGGGEAERQIQDLRQKSLDQLRSLRDAVAAYYAETKDPSVLAFLQALDGNIAQVVSSQERLKQQAEDIAVSSLSGFFSDLATGAKSFKDAFLDMVRSFIAGIAQMIAKELALKAVQSATSFFVGHTGGIAGMGGTVRTVQAGMSAFLANTASPPRYHSGGIAGMRPDEVPAILQRGEEVLTKSDPRHRNNGGGLDRPAPGYRIVNVFDPSFVPDQMDSAAGERVILNAIGRNPGRVKQLLGA